MTTLCLSKLTGNKITASYFAPPLDLKKERKENTDQKEPP